VELDGHGERKRMTGASSTDDELEVPNFLVHMQGRQGGGRPSTSLLGVQLLWWR
jgi:hypothetical protein